MHNTLILFRREFASYFGTPLALVFIVIFLALAKLLTFFLGGFYERGLADFRIIQFRVSQRAADLNALFVQSRT